MRISTRVWALGLLMIACGSRPPTATDAAPGDAGLDGRPVELPRHNTILGRPTDRSIAISVLADRAGDRVGVEYGTALDPAGGEIVDGIRTAPVTAAAAGPVVVELTGLAPDTAYHYRLRYQPAGGEEEADHVHGFHTARARGATFHVGIQGDSHPERPTKMFHPELYRLTMAQASVRRPDFYVMLGDDFSIEKIIEDFKRDNYDAGHVFHRAIEGAAPFASYAALPHPFSRPMIVDGEGAPTGAAAYRAQRAGYLGLVGADAALMLVNGNHEQAHAANLGGVFNNAAVWAADARLTYYPLPAPDGFYTGDDARLTAVNGYPTLAAADGLLRDYYAFTWGDALFVMIDPYWHSPAQSPDSSLFDGDPEDPWLATLGDAQYAWLERTLTTSTARWKFVFAHHINGNGRGAAAAVGDTEWGGPVAEFRARRPTWARPIHQLLVDTGVTIFFQGHDHLFAREVVDGVVYQEVPNPADHSYFPYNCDAYVPASIRWRGPAGYGRYDPASAVWLPNSGFLDLTVGPAEVRVDYVRSYRPVDLATDPNGVFAADAADGEVAFTYHVPARPEDTRPADVRLTCPGASPPAGWQYNP